MMKSETFVFAFNLKNYIWSGDGKHKIYFGDNSISTKNIDKVPVDWKLTRKWKIWYCYLIWKRWDVKNSLATMPLLTLFTLARKPQPNIVESETKMSWKRTWKNNVLDGIEVYYRIPSMKQLKALLLPPVGILFHHRITSMKRLGSLQLPPNCKRFSLLITAGYPAGSSTELYYFPWKECLSITGYWWSSSKHYYSVQLGC